MNKICTSLKQSQKLIELGIDVKTADMYYSFDYNVEEYDEDAQIIPKSELGQHFSLFPEDVAAWSLTALMELMNRNCYNVSLNCHGAEWNVKFDDSEEYKDFTKDYAVDAVFEMIVWLLENKKL